MKKSIFMLAVGALTLSACSQSDVIEEGAQSSAIGFNTLVGKNSRAIINDEFSSFQVFGSYTPKESSKRITVFNDVTVTKNGTEWGYTTARYWVPGAEYTFAAYAMEGTAPTGFRANYTPEGTLNLDGVLADNTYQNDLVYATAGSDANPIVGKATGNDVVAFTFTHILSRLNFHFISGFPAGYDVEISNVRLNNICDKGHFDGTPGGVGTWTSADRTANNVQIKPDFSAGTIISAKDGDTAAKEITSDWVYVIPFEYKSNNVDIYFDIDVKQGETPIYGARNIKGTWAPKWALNNSYTYNITVSGTEAGLEEIKFSGTVNEWVTGTPANPDFILSGGEVPSPGA